MPPLRLSFYSLSTRGVNYVKSISGRNLVTLSREISHYPFTVMCQVQELLIYVTLSIRSIHKSSG